MKTYIVNVERVTSYTVMANNEEEAIDIALEEQCEENDQQTTDAYVVYVGEE